MTCTVHNAVLLLWKATHKPREQKGRQTGTVCCHTAQGIQSVLAAVALGSHLRKKIPAQFQCPAEACDSA